MKSLIALVALALLLGAGFFDASDSGAAEPDTDGDSLGLTDNNPGGACSAGQPEPKFRDCIEAFVGTRVADPCADTPVADDEPTDSMPADFDDNQAVNVVDRARLVLAINQPYNARYDLNADGAVNVVDRGIVVLYIGLDACPAQPTFPIAGNFYYPWFPGTWGQGSHYTPTLGFYDSSNTAVIDQHLDWMEYAHQEAAISSWWGVGDDTDSNLTPILARTGATNSPIKWSIYYEAEGYGDPTVPQIVSDLNYLAPRFAHDQWLKVNGKPVVFVYADALDGGGMASRWAQVKAQFPNVYIVLKVYAGYASDPNQPDSWHQYGPAVAVQSHLPHSYVVSPGFWHANEGTPRLSRDLTRFENDLAAAVASGANWQLVTTWSEWGEGTIVEPATQFGETFLDAMCRQFPGPGSCNAAPTPSPSPTPGPPTPTPGGNVLIGAGDIVPDCVGGASMPNAIATAGIINANPTATVFTAGDNQYEEGTAQQYSQCYGTNWGAFKGRTKPVPGNHEYLTGGAADYYGYFGILAGDPTKGYYAYDLAGWRVYALNSSNVNKATELSWLQGDLAANPRTCSLAYFHHPVYTAGPHADDEGGMRDIWRALYDAGADLVVTGHDHSYQRYAPLNRDGNSPLTGGMSAIVVGTGGRNLTTQSRVPAGLEAASDGNTQPTFGVLKLILNTGGYDWQFLGTGGGFSDSGNRSCR